MNRLLVGAVGGAAAAAVVVSGCSSDAHSGAGSAAAVPEYAGPGANPKVVVDGRQYTFDSKLRCDTVDGTITLTQFRLGDAQYPHGYGFTVGMREGDPLTVGQVTVADATVLFAAQPGLNPVGATRSGKTYTLSGQITDILATSDLMEPVTKPFEIEVTCP